MITILTYLVVSILIAALTFPRKWLHIVGCVGMIYMAFWAMFYVQDGPMTVLNGATSLMHGFMVYKFRTKETK